MNEGYQAIHHIQLCYFTIHTDMVYKETDAGGHTLMRSIVTTRLQSKLQLSRGQDPKQGPCGEKHRLDLRKWTAFLPAIGA